MARRKTLTRSVVVLVLVALLVIVGSGTYLSNLIRDGGLVPKVGDASLDLVVADIGDGNITLRLPDEADDASFMRQAGLLGLKGENGYNQVAEIVDESAREVRRRFIEVTGPPGIGERVRLDSHAFTGDPASAFGLSFENVFFTSSAGEFPAWFIDGEDDTWVVIVHGRNSNPGEALRVIPTFVRAGMPILAINYRNDPDLPPSEDGFHRYGLVEWMDVEASVRYAMDNGAKDVVLFGYSMGGGIVVNFMYQSLLSDQIAALIMDSPMLHLGRTVDWGGQQLGYPQPILEYAKFAAAVRFDVDFEATDYLARSNVLNVPIFLVHGSDDSTVPFSISDDLASARPDLVTPYFLEGVDHVLSWNVDPQAYETALADFLAAIPD